jgi:CheY-like chemotaxis protein
MTDVILVIVEDPSLLARLGEALAGDDTVAVLASGPADALHRLAGGMVPDAVVIDLDMTDGLVTLARVECATDDLLPVVALSSRPRRLLAAGIADGVVMKPFEVGRLRASVQRACARERRGAM